MNKRRRRKNKVAKRKTTLSQDYKTMEEEVNTLLANVTLEPDDEDTISKQVEFFTGCLAVSHNEQESSSKPSSSSGSVLEALPPAASYVQIEDSDPVRLVHSTKVDFESNLLYIPVSVQKNVIKDVEAQQHIVLNKDGVYVENQVNFKTPNMTRMVNRLIEEENLDIISLSNCLKNTQIFCQNVSLYKTECEKHFDPIYYEVPYYQDQPIISTNKRVLTISLKELRILTHPMQTEEHKLANKLEEVCRTYHEKRSENLIDKITSELSTVRQVVNDLLENSEESDLEKLERYMEYSRNLRNTLHKEELVQKNLIKTALQTWMALKNTRAKQGYNWTIIKLLIRSEETNIKEEEKAWNERFRVELNEILREEFGAYYREKRNRQHKATFVLHKPDVERIKSVLRETLTSCSRLPSEPQLELNMGRLSNINKCLDKKKEFYFKIFLDDDFMECTKHLQLAEDFVIPIRKTFSVILEKRLPESVKIEIYEVKTLPQDTKLAELFLPMSRVINSSFGFDDTLEFTSKNLKISGQLKVSLTCTNFESQFNEEDPLVVQRSKHAIEIPKKVLKHWYDNHLINPLDPDCLHLVKTLNEQEECEEIPKKYDTFDLNEHQLEFCSEDEIKNNQRFKLLRSRYKNEIKYMNFKFVPLFDNELEEEGEEKVIEEGNWMDPIDLQKHQGKKYLKKLFETIQNHCMNLSKTEEDASNLLIGNETPTVSAIISTIFGFLGSARALSPLTTTQVTLPSIKLSNFNIVVNVVRATGVPVRNFTPISARRNSSASLSHHTLSYTNVSPYVTVSYKDKIARTTTAEGSNPTWNKEIVLQISGYPTEFKDDVKFQLFDEYVEDLISGDSARTMEVYQRIHTNWLGELRLPLKTIFSRQSIEGVFELSSPRVLLGYTKASLDQTDAGSSSEDGPEISEIVYLSLYINIEPQFEPVTLNTSCLECSELKEVKAYIQEWCIQVKDMFPERFIDPLICLASGKRVCITRLLEPIPLPVEKSEDSANLIKRYVSLIPVFKFTNACTGLNGVWLNNQVVLDTSWSSPKDLGVLLTCFHLSAGIRAWLVLGIGFPYGESTFTLLHEGNDYIFVDPYSGKKYSTKDVYCPVSRVYYVVGQDNVYCNLQSETRVSMINFNLEDSRSWMGLFEKSNPAPIGGVHKLNYSYKPLLSTVELRKNIERKIMKKVNSWRSTRKTVWNRAFHSIMYNILNDLEQDVTHERDSEDYLEKLAKAVPTFKLFGFTLNFGYTNLPSISDRIRSTGIHLNSDKNVEFSVAVHIHQYPNNILSVWVFLVSAIPII